MRVKLGEVCEILNGYAFKSEMYVEKGIRIIRIANVQNGYIEDSAPVFYPTDDADANKCLLCADDLLMSLTGNVGRVALLDKAFLPAALNQRVACLRVKDTSLLNKRFLFALLNSPKFENACNLSSRGVAQKNMSTEWLKDYSIPLPSIEKQMEIATVLDKVSSLIAMRKKQLQKLDDLVKAHFVEMFGNPVSNEMCWAQEPLSACLESIDNGKSFVCDSAARTRDWPAVLKLSAATYGFYRPEENKAVLDDKQFVDAVAVRTGDLLFTRKNTPELVGMCAYVYGTPPKLMMPDLIFRLNTAENCNKVFLWKLINHDLFRECIQAIATGSAKSMSNISKERLLNLRIILPPIGLQEQFAGFVEQTDKSKLTIQQSLDKLILLKESLLEKYFGAGV